VSYWFGRSLKYKFGVLLVLAIVLQLLASPDTVTLFDILATPLTAAIWMAVGLVLWKGYTLVDRRIGREED